MELCIRYRVLVVLPERTVRSWKKLPHFIIFCHTHTEKLLNTKFMVFSEFNIWTTFPLILVPNQMVFMEKGKRICKL